MKILTTLAFILFSGAASAQVCNPVSITDDFLNWPTPQERLAILQITPAAVESEGETLARRDLAIMANQWRNAEAPEDGSTVYSGNSFTLEADTVVVAMRGQSGIRLGNPLRTLNGRNTIDVTQVCTNGTCGQMDMSWIDETQPRMGLVVVDSDSDGVSWSLVVTPCLSVLADTFSMEDYNRIVQAAE